MSARGTIFRARGMRSCVTLAVAALHVSGSRRRGPSVSRRPAHGVFGSECSQCKSKMRWCLAAVVSLATAATANHSLQGTLRNKAAQRP